MLNWKQLEEYVLHCRSCSLCLTRNRPVMGRGNHQAEIMFIAEAPGAMEDKEGIPFVGPAGKVLDRLMEDCGLTRDEVYITNIIKCHPEHNRDPRPEEKEKCFPVLRYETYLLKPKIIVCLGRVAAQQLIDPDYRITRQHGQWIERKGYYLTAVYHPSALLRDPDKMEETKQDFRKIVEKKEELHDRQNKSTDRDD